MTEEITAEALADSDLTTRYEQAVTTLTAPDPPDVESVLACLRLRDALARQLDDNEASADIGRILVVVLLPMVLAAAAGLDVAANNLGRLLILEDRPDDAVAVLLPLERRMYGAAIEPEVYYRILKNLGWARVAQGRPADAVAYLATARQLLPRDAPAHCLLGRAYAELGDTKDAVKSWDACLARARDLDPDEDRWIAEADAFRAEAGR